MNKKNALSKLIGPIAVAVVLGLLYWLDTVYISWRRQAFQTFNTKPFFYFTIALLILFAVLVIFLAWLLLVYSRPSWVALVFCLLAGTSILGLLFLYIAAPRPGSNFESPRIDWAILCDLQPWLCINDLAGGGFRLCLWPDRLCSQNSSDNCVRLIAKKDSSQPNQLTGIGLLIGI